jgi:hypothetical protein
MNDLSGAGHKPEFHAVQLYEEGSFPSNAVLNFLLGAIQAKSGVLVVATSANLQALADSLSPRGISLTKLIQVGRIVIKDAAVLLAEITKNDRFDASEVKLALASLVDPLVHKFGAVSIYGEMVDLLLKDGQIDWMLEVENIWNEYCTDKEARVMCGFHADWIFPLPGMELVDRISERHTEMIPIELQIGSKLSVEVREKLSGR